jgi:hypothetical protein
VKRIIHWAGGINPAWSVSWAGDKACTAYLPSSTVYKHRVRSARAFGKISPDHFVVNHHLPSTCDATAVRADRLGKAGNGALANLSMPPRQQSCGMLVLAGIFGIGSQPGVQITRVIGIQLLLDHLGDKCRVSAMLDILLVQMSAKKRQPQLPFSFRGQPAYFSTWVTSRTAPVSALVVMAA